MHVEDVCESNDVIPLTVFVTEVVGIDHISTSVDGQELVVSLCIELDHTAIHQLVLEMRAKSNIMYPISNDLLFIHSSNCIAWKLNLQQWKAFQTES